jgi:hypothetical protein
MFYEFGGTYALGQIPENKPSPKILKSLRLKGLALPDRA